MGAVRARSHNAGPTVSDPTMPDTPWKDFDHIRFDHAAERLKGVVERTPLLELPSPDPRVRIHGKLENRQVTGAFKARGAWNNMQRLSAEQRAAGVVGVSSGNHGKALAWAAAKAGVAATIVMPKDAYPNKIQACRDEGAEVVLTETRAAAVLTCDEFVAAGRTLVHPYDMEGTVEGAGTVGLEIAQDMPDVEVVMLPIGGGGLSAGSSLALRRALGHELHIIGVEPEGAPNMIRGLAALEPVELESITTQVQGLCPPAAGRLNIEICSLTLSDVWTVSDEQVFQAQATMVALGEVVEPAGAATYAAALAGMSNPWIAKRTESNPLRVVVVVSGGNPDPEQLRRLQAASV